MKYSDEEKARRWPKDGSRKWGRPRNNPNYTARQLQKLQNKAKKNAKKSNLNSASNNDTFDPLVTNMPNSPSESQTLWESENSPDHSMILEFSDDET